MTETSRSPLTHGSLFAGIGGFDLGFERAGIKTVWQVEIDPFCRKVLERRFPDVQRIKDVKEVGSDTERVDVLSGGFPCQDISNAGSFAGIDGPRTGLWREFVRVIGALRPKFVVMENVPALLVRGMGDVLGGLASCGYDAEWEVVPACLFGAPHTRERLFIVAYPETFGLIGRRIIWPSAERLETRGCDQDLLRPWSLEPKFSRVAYGVPGRLDRVGAIGNAIVPQIAEWIGKRIIECGGGLTR
jgi:DNA (cytosine-5)-methyltransferase 1